MIDPLWLRQTAPTPSPQELAGYLRQRGWQLAKSGARWSRFEKPTDGTILALEVPQLSEAPDYAHAAGIVIENLGRLEHREPAQVLRDVKSVATDIVRLGIVSAATHDGRIPVETGHRVFEAARDMLLAAACSIDDARAAFPRRKSDDAMALVRSARFGRSELGSFVLSIECDVPPELQGGAESAPEDVPMARRASARLAQALTGLGAATRESASSGHIEPFRSRIQDGVSANLCDVMATMLDATAAESIWASFAFAACRPFPHSWPERISFGPSSLGVLREAARQLRASATYPAFELTGFVHRLDSARAEAGGVVTIRAEIEGRWRQVSVTLSAADYARALRFHERTDVVRCVGNLERRGNAWALHDLREFEALPLP